MDLSLWISVYTIYVVLNHTFIQRCAQQAVLKDFAAKAAVFLCNVMSLKLTPGCHFVYSA